MNEESHPTRDDVENLGQRLDMFAELLSPPEQTLFTSLLHLAAQTVTEVPSDPSENRRALTLLGPWLAKNVTARQAAGSVNRNAGDGATRVQPIELRVSNLPLSEAGKDRIVAAFQKAVLREMVTHGSAWGDWEFTGATEGMIARPITDVL